METATPQSIIYANICRAENCKLTLYQVLQILSHSCLHISIRFCENIVNTYNWRSEGFLLGMGSKWMDKSKLFFIIIFLKFLLEEMVQVSAIQVLGWVNLDLMTSDKDLFKPDYSTLAIFLFEKQISV